MNLNFCLVVLNHNGVAYLKSNLKEIFKLCRTSGVDFYVGDDNSTDQSIEYLQNKSIPFFQNKGKNNGYAANLNNVLKHLISKKYDAFLIANSDIELSESFFEQLKNVIQIVGAEKKWGLLGFTEVNKKISEQHMIETSNKKPSLENSIEGFLYLMNKKLINAIGFFDENYFMYGEDNDYFFRTQKAGYLIYKSEIKVFHYSEGSKSTEKINSWLAYRNALLFAKKNLSFFGKAKTIFSIIHIIYNPFYKRKDPSVNRLRRSGFIKNHKFLLESIRWNLKNKHES